MKNRNIMRALAFMLAFVLMLESVNMSAFATETRVTTEESQKKEKLTGASLEKNGITYTFNLQNTWENGYNAIIRIENNTGNIVDNWKLELFYDGDICNVWNAQIETKEEGKYIIKNAVWNQDIENGGCVEFGLTGQGKFETFPTEYVLIGEVYKNNSEDYLVDYAVNSFWDNGFTATVTITNNKKFTIEDWILEFDFDAEITNIWNGVITSCENGHYVIKNAGYNPLIMPGQSIYIGIMGAAGNIDDCMPINYDLRSFADNTEITNKREGKVIIDTSELILDENNRYYVPENIYSICGNLYSPKNVKKLYYSTNNTFGLDLVSGSLEIEEKWIIKDIPLALGYNELTVIAEYLDGSKVSDTVVLAYMYEDRAYGIDGLVKDSDSDGLEDYIENIYGTNILKSDTDEDGLSDYTELAIIGTKALLSDSDGNGILDGDEDFDKDGLTNSEEEHIGTLIYGTDSDYDNLTDYEEVYIYNTNPLISDTDGDGVSDGFEIINGYNPLVSDEKFVVGKNVEIGNNIYELKLTADGEVIESLKAVPVNDSKVKYGLISGYLDSAIDFELDGNFDKAELKIYFDSSYLEIENFVPALYYIDEENHEMVEIEGDWDGVSNYLYVEVPHFSTYILLNKTEFNRVWEETIKASAVASDGSTNLNIVFVTDLSGSMRGSKLTTMKNSINSFIDVLSSEDKAGIVSFTSDASVVSELTNDKTLLKSKVSSMSAVGLTSIYTGIDKAVEMLSNNVDGYKMMIVFTDGYDEPSTSYDYNYKAIIEKATAENICIYTIGIGTIDKELLTKAAEETGGLFYYAENAFGLTSKVEKIQKEVIDYTTDSNNDGISDYFSKLLCDGRLITWKTEPVMIAASYEELQADTDGDIDDDGILNGEELKIETNKEKVVQIIINSDMEDSDTDGDSLSDGLEKKLGTNPNVKNISGSDYNSIVTDNGNYVASLTAEDYQNGTWLKFQLAVGNAVTRFKLSYVEDYKRALIDFINVYNQTTIENNTLKEIAEIYESDANEILLNFLALTQSLTDETLKADRKMQEAIEELKDAYIHMNAAAKKLNRMDSWMKFKDTNAEYLTQRMKYSKYFGEVQELTDSIKAKKVEVPDFVANLSTKTKSLIMKAASTVQWGIIGLNTFDDIYNTCVAYGSLSTEMEQYDYIMYYLEYVKIFSNISELREAAKQVEDAIKSDKEKRSQMVDAVFYDFKNNLVPVGVDVLISTFGPLAWAASFGESLGDVLSGTSALDEETLKLIALGNSADIYANHIDYVIERDSSEFDYYLVDDSDLQELQLLAQLRIVGEDEAARGYDKTGIVLKFIQSIGNCSQDEYENGLRENIEKLINIGEKVGFSVSGKYDGTYLYN